jgi:hypothetical protein
MMRTKQVIQVADNAAEPVPTPAARFGSARSTIWVPMLKDNELVGGITLFIARRSGRSPKRKSRWCRASPLRP